MFHLHCYFFFKFDMHAQINWQVLCILSWNAWILELCILGNFSCFYCLLLTFFKFNFYKKFFQEYYQKLDKNFTYYMLSNFLCLCCHLLSFFYPLPPLRSREVIIGIAFVCPSTRQSVITSVIQSISPSVSQSIRNTFLSAP